MLRWDGGSKLPASGCSLPRRQPYLRRVCGAGRPRAPLRVALAGVALRASRASFRVGLAEHHSSTICMKQTFSLARNISY